MFNNYKKRRMEVNAHEVIRFVRLLGHFGLRFEISDEYCKHDDLDTSRKERFRMFIIYGTKKQLAEFDNARNIILRYRMY